MRAYRPSSHPASLVLATRGGQVTVDEMRGMSLYFDMPRILLSGSGYPRPRLFSLLHEFVHLVLHTEGLCDVVTGDRPRSADRTLEARCNAIAVVLMPSAKVRARPEVIARIDVPMSWTYDTLRAVAAQFGVIAEAFLERLSTPGLAPVDLYRQHRAEFITAHDDEADRNRNLGRQLVPQRRAKPRQGVRARRDRRSPPPHRKQHRRGLLGCEGESNSRLGPCRRVAERSVTDQFYSFDTRAILNGWRDLFRPTVF